MKLPIDDNLRGSSTTRQLEDEVEKQRQGAGWNDDDHFHKGNYRNKEYYNYFKMDNSSVKSGGYSTNSPNAEHSSANHKFQSISKPLGFVLVFISMAACFSIFCAILRKARRKRIAIAEKEVDDGGVGIGGDKSANLLRGRSRTPAGRLQSSSPPPRKYRGQSRPEYGDESDRSTSRSSLPPSHGRGGDYVPMVDQYAPNSAPRTVNNKTPNRGRSRSRNIDPQDSRTRSKTRGRSMPPLPVKMTRRT
jgi:hypothetical protein